MQSIKDNFQLVTDPNQIIISVTNPIQVKNTLSNYVEYTVQGSEVTGNFNVQRRYSDFDHVRKAVLSKWPGCYVPPIPKKRIVGNNQFLFIESRREGLSQFCQQVAQLKHIWYSKEFQVFLTGKQDVQKALKQIQNESIEGIVSKYQQKLTNLSIDDFQGNLNDKVSTFQQYIKKISQKLSHYKQSCKQILDSYTNNLQQYGVLFNYIFPEYEKHFLSVYVSDGSQQSTQGKLVFANANDLRLAQLVTQFKKAGEGNKLAEMYHLLSRQQREVQAFQEVFKLRNKYEQLLKSHQIKEKDLLLQQSKLNAGKQSIFKSILKSNIEDQKKNVQISIDLNSLKIKSLAQLCSLITVIIANFQIPRFKAYKVKKYFQTIKAITQFQIEISSIKEEICDHVLQNKNIMQLVEIEAQ